MAVTKRTLATQDGPTILVGHSYGGAVISEAGNHPKVSALVYIAAFAPDKGESVGSLIKDPAPGAPVPPILPPQDGFLFLDRAKFPASFAADVDPEKAAFMADSQVPWACLRWNCIHLRDSLRLAQTFVVSEEECAILHDRPPDGSTELIPMERGLCRVEEIPGVEHAVPDVFKCISVEILGPRACGSANNPAR